MRRLYKSRRPPGAKQITPAQILGEKAINLISRRVLDMGFLWHPTNAPLEAGIDGHIELRDPTTGEVSNSWIAVQSKGVSRLERETPDRFEYTCKTRDLEYWRRGNMPVLLVVARPDTDEAWWVELKQYFRDAGSQTRRIVFDKRASLLSSTSGDDLLRIAQAAGAGTYFRPPQRQEHLHSNLLVVRRLPSCLYRGDSLFSDPSKLHEILREQIEWPPREWLLHDGVLHSVYDLRTEPWLHVCDRGTVEVIETTEWSDSSNPVTQRHFVWLLNQCLRAFCARIGMSFDRETNVFYYKKTADLSPRRVNYRSRSQKASRFVFKDYRKTNSEELAYYRHVGFEPRFRRFDGQWCLEINPTYRYTTDGDTLHPFREEYLSKIKSIEGSGAVGGLVVMFAALMQDPTSLYVEEYPHLGFGELLGVDVPVGIDDSNWMKRDIAPPSSESNVDSSNDDGLTDDAGSLFEGDGR